MIDARGVVVYTTIFGASDSLKMAPLGADRCVCFTDDITRDPEGWQLVHQEASDPRREAWHLRCVPHLLFSKYSTVVWIDASFTLVDLPQLVRDAGAALIAALVHHERASPYREAARLVRIGQSERDAVGRQVLQYLGEGFQSPHLSISCILVRKRSREVAHFNETWDEQIRRHPGDNTQVSLDYSAWRHGLEIRALRGTRHDNPYARHDHADHSSRRRPYVQRSA